MNAGKGIATWQLRLVEDHYEITTVIPETPAVSLDEVSLALPGGAYTTFRTYEHSKVLRIDDHMTRLCDSAAQAHRAAPLAPRPLRAALATLLHNSPLREARVRVTLDLEQEPGTLYVSMEELHLLPPEAYHEGVRVDTRCMQRENPKAKLTAFISTAADYRAHLPQGVNETLMVQEDGRILEGLSSNFFGVKAGALWTAEEGVLPGITRATLLEIAHQLGIAVHFEAVRMDELAALDECFITSASRGVLPVVQIGEQVIGRGIPGPVTQSLVAGFETWIRAEVTEI